MPIRYRFSLEDASDVFQSVCVILLQNLRTLRSVETLSTWLYVTTRRECWKVAKQKSREVQLEEWDEAFAEPEGEKLILQHRIRQALDLVSEKCQQLLKPCTLLIPLCLTMRFRSISQFHSEVLVRPGLDVLKNYGNYWGKKVKACIFLVCWRSFNSREE